DAFLFNNLSLKLRIGKAIGKVDPMFQSIFGNLFNGPFRLDMNVRPKLLKLAKALKTLKWVMWSAFPFKYRVAFVKAVSPELRVPVTILRRDRCMGLGTTCSLVARCPTL